MTRQLKRFGFHFAAILLIAVLLNNCSKNEVKPASTPVQPETAPAVLNTAIVESITPTPSSTLDIFEAITIKFHQGVNKVIVLDGKRYRPILKTIVLEGAASQMDWKSDSTQVTFSHSDAFAPKSQLTVKIVGYWEVNKNGSWQIVNWQNVDVSETKISTFTVVDGKNAIEDSNVKYAYPIPNQYHFFPKEHPKGFVKLAQGQSYLFTDAGFDTYVEFQTPSSSLIQPLDYDVANNQISYSIPDGLLHETIYTVSFKRKNKSTGEITVLYQYACRTSKFNTFTEKVASFDLTGTVARGIFILWRVDYLKQNFTSAEYFDDFEMETKTETLAAIGSPPIPYATNLVQFSAIFSGNDWFDTKINPWLYAPWTDPTFKTTIKLRDTTTVGLKPKKAMSIQGVAGGKLTAAQISSNSAPAISGQSPYLLYHVCAYLDNDFLEIQQQVANKYLNLPGPGNPRENDVIWNQFPIMMKGNYYYNIMYKLPDGTTTSSIKLFMYNPIG